jgi:hypothetical protein
MEKMKQSNKFIISAFILAGINLILYYGLNIKISSFLLAVWFPLGILGIGIGLSEQGRNNKWQITQKNILKKH